MRKITCSPIARTYSNFGQHCEQMLAYTLLGEMRTADKVPFDIESDIPEYHMSVKSSHASLVSPHLLSATTYEGQIEEFFRRVASSCFAYVTMTGIAYVMTADEFNEFVHKFSYFDVESGKAGKLHKVRLRAETKIMRSWLDTHCA